MEQPLSRAHHRQLYGMAFRLCALEQCTRSRDAECFRSSIAPSAILTATWLHAFSLVQVQMFGEIFHRVSLWNWCCFTPFFPSIFMRRPAWVKKRIEDARKHHIMRDTCRQFSFSELSVVWDDVQKSTGRCAEKLPGSCFVCESVETAQSPGDETHAVATRSRARKQYALLWFFAPFGGQLCPWTCARTKTRADVNVRRPLCKQRCGWLIFSCIFFHCICCI